MVATLALALLLKGPVEPRLTVHLSIDQSGGLSAVQLQLTIDEVRKIWSDAGVVVTSGRYGEPPRGSDRGHDFAANPADAPPVEDGAERTLAWVTPGAAGRSAPLLFVSLPAVTETVLSTEAFDMPVKRLTHALRDRLIAQAIGRVAAHELGHYLLQHAGHHERGLMRREVLAVELVGDWLDRSRSPTPSAVVRQEIAALARLQAPIEQ